jgi:hypothetical protein
MGPDQVCLGVHQEVETSCEVVFEGDGSRHELLLGRVVVKVG